MSAAYASLRRRVRHHVLDPGDGDAEPVEDGAVPLRVALREVVVDRDEVDVVAGERVQVERRARDEGLSLTGLHLRDVALVEDDAAHQLDVEQALPGLALARLADGGERLVEDLVERLAVLDPLLELGGLRAELVVRERLEVGLERGDVRGLLGEALEAASLADPQDLLEAAEARAGHGLEGTVCPPRRPAPTLSERTLHRRVTRREDDPSHASPPRLADPRRASSLRRPRWRC